MFATCSALLQASVLYVTSVMQIENFLSRQDRQGKSLQGLAYHSAIKDELRNRNLQAFLAPPGPDDVRKALICTDRSVPGRYVQHLPRYWPGGGPCAHMPLQQGAAFAGPQEVLILRMWSTLYCSSFLATLASTSDGLGGQPEVQAREALCRCWYKASRFV
jgi:hypothetical protein